MAAKVERCRSIPRGAQFAALVWKMRGNAILIKSKDDIRKRPGTSTDDANAVVLAWHSARMRRARKCERGGSIREIASGRHGAVMRQTAVQETAAVFTNLQRSGVRKFRTVEIRN